MFAILLIIHFLSLAAGIGIGVANMALGIRAAAAQGPAMIALRQSQGALGRIGLYAIILLWITGFWLWQGYNDGTTDPVFLAKLGFVVILTALSLDLNLQGARAAKGGAPVDPAYAKRLGMIMGLMSLSAVITAVMVFG
jgi:uncharacterized membrane protein